MINLNKLDKKLSNKTFNVGTYNNKYHFDKKNYYVVLNVIKRDFEGIYIYLEKETKIPKTSNYKQIIKYINNFKKEFKKHGLNKNKDGFKIYTLTDQN